MNLLALDTATEACSAAIKINQQVHSLFEVCPQQHSQKILPMVDQLLKTHQSSLKDFDYLVFGRGPGSFTGVRIATGMIQGLSLGTELKVVGVSTLATMAQQVIDTEGAERIAVAIDARMDEVYFGQFINRNGLAVLDGIEQVLAPEQALQLLTELPDKLAGTGWQAYPAFSPLVAQIGAAQVLYPNAAYMLQLASRHIALGEVFDCENIQPVYLRDKVTWKKLPGRE
ncbi:tRNA (adenosine(37)-N6)-threonylcarbamoyltransferase complex dimerization subunit type 1 TsaB [Aliiglaciecola sp. LCG003]|uniref:tRNA (adenosine(37)-N6)-threonylcarbamoyltransferase complex dimerization subunit type 1 TsaB n=1 Tax=Aliiglaciecola sp. LCG003 TaxID=3053655 RepID=UPI0025733F6F|nr:tRNA (adenosine(37)-N6)-threonylcarbamoyltransferase complex dimerization subunit type 1 TsaB [Aliiglaciecola sp. LCG003]WJG08210.1 tRNA (adenosine(37)-N6)-threonylcarbamoyltransferase complex dimerization subunit type 1 TsaB [Aliiglaciecola sp. LCG003]